MQTFLDMWNASPGGVILFSIPVLIFAGFVILIGFYVLWKGVQPWLG